MHHIATGDRHQGAEQNLNREEIKQNTIELHGRTEGSRVAPKKRVTQDTSKHPATGCYFAAATRPAGKSGDP
jgi:hypothetical protein